jgi:hypothetical protein
MKIKCMLFCAFLFSAIRTVAQDQQQSPVSEQIAHKIANKMKDSLGLSDQQCKGIFNINMQLHQQKHDARQQDPGNPSLGSYLQRIENTRDSLYKAILPDDKFILYKQKKRYLISAE